MLLQRVERALLNALFITAHVLRMVSGHTYKGGGGWERIRQQSQFTQLQKKARLTDPISTNVKQRRAACCDATVLKKS